MNPEVFWSSAPPNMWTAPGCGLWAAWLPCHPLLCPPGDSQGLPNPPLVPSGQGLPKRAQSLMIPPQAKLKGGRQPSLWTRRTRKDAEQDILLLRPLGHCFVQQDPELSLLNPAPWGTRRRTRTAANLQPSRPRRLEGARFLVSGGGCREGTVTAAPRVTAGDIAGDAALVEPRLSRAELPSPRLRNLPAPKRSP